MEINLILLLISFFIFTGFLVIARIKFGMTKTISDIYYEIPEKKRWIFTIIFTAFSLPLMIVGETGLMFFAGSGAILVGTAPAFKSKKKENNMESKVHVIGAVICIFLGAISLWLDFNLLYLTSIIAASLLLTLFKVKNHTYYVEALAYYVIWYGLLISRTNLI